MKFKNIYLVGSIILISLSFLFSGCNKTESVDIPDDAQTVVYSKGNANAKVKIIEYSDYECPFCSRFALEVYPQIKNEYIDTGKVYYSFKDLPIQFHRYAQKASEATYCAGEQEEEKFWDMHMKLFENQKNLKKDDLISYAEELELNIEAFKECLDSDKFRNAVLKNKQDSLDAGIEATPTIVINDVKLRGFQPYENIKKVIEAELK